MRRGTFLAGGGSVAAVATAAIPANAQSFASQTSIAVLCPLYGNDRRLGEQLVNGVRAAVDEANRTRGSLDRFYALRTFDDDNTVAGGMLNARFAIDDQSQSVAIGHLSGKVTDAVARFYAEANMPLIVPATSYDPITAHGFRNVFRLPTKDSVEGSLHAKYVKRERRGKRIAVLFQDGDYGPDVANGFIRQARADGLTAIDIPFSWEKPDFTAAAQLVTLANPDLVFLAGLAREMGRVVPALRTAGYAGPLSGSQGFFDGGLVAAYGGAVADLIVSSPMPPLNIVPEAYRVKADFESRYGALGPISAFGYAATQMVVIASRRTYSAQRVALARAFAQPIAFDTIVGSFTFDPFGDANDPNVYFYQLQSGNWRYLRAAHPSSFIVR